MPATSLWCVNTGLPIAYVVARSYPQHVIGCENRLPWRLRTDLRRCRTLPWGKPMIMGRKSWDSIGRPLPGRHTVVLTRDPGFRAAGAEITHSWADAVQAATAAAGRLGAEEIIVAGGAEIYRLAIPSADRVRLTRVHASPEGQVVFVRHALPGLTNNWLVQLKATALVSSDRLSRQRIDRPPKLRRK